MFVNRKFPEFFTFILGINLAFNSYVLYASSSLDCYFWQRYLCTWHYIRCLITDV